MTQPARLPQAPADAVEWVRSRWEDANEPSPEHFAAMAALFRTHQTVVSAIDTVLKPYELSRTAYLLLATLQISRDHTRPLGKLSKQLLVHPTTITMVCDQLERRGLVARAPHPTDRRTILATLTPAGLELVENANRSMGDASFGLTGVSMQLAVTLTEILRQVREKIGDIA